MSAIANRLRRISMTIRKTLPELLVPQSEESAANHQEAELTRLGKDLLLLIRDLKSQENLIRIQARSKSPDPWATKQKLIDVRLEREEAEALGREIEDTLRRKGLNPMEVGFKVHELIENTEIHLDDAQRALQEGKTIHTSIGPATNITMPHMTRLHMLDTAVPMLTFAYLLLRWAASKRSAGTINKLST